MACQHGSVVFDQSEVMLAGYDFTIHERVNTHMRGLLNQITNGNMDDSLKLIEAAKHDFAVPFLYYQKGGKRARIDAGQICGGDAKKFAYYVAAEMPCRECGEVLLSERIKRALGANVIGHQSARRFWRPGREWALLDSPDPHAPWPMPIKPSVKNHEPMRTSVAAEFSVPDGEGDEGVYALRSGIVAEYYSGVQTYVGDFERRRSGSQFANPYWRMCAVIIPFDGWSIHHTELGNNKFDRRLVFSLTNGVVGETIMLPTEIMFGQPIEVWAVYCQMPDGLVKKQWLTLKGVTGEERSFRQ